MLERLAIDEVNAAPVSVGLLAPDFELFSAKGESWRLSEHTGRVIVMLCYPQNETLVCTRQMCSVRDHWEEYVDTKAEIVGISPGTPGEHQSFAANHRLPMPLLADPERKITKIFGAHWLWPISMTRAIIVIDANGVVRSRRVMLRAFRPSDREVITSIYRARGDAMQQEYKDLTGRNR